MSKTIEFKYDIGEEVYYVCESLHLVMKVRIDAYHFDREDGISLWVDDDILPEDKFFLSLRDLIKKEEEKIKSSKEILDMANRMLKCDECV